MFRQLAVGLLARRLLREIVGIREELHALNGSVALLARDLIAAAPESDPATVASETGLSYLDGPDAELAQAYVARTEQQTGHTPTDEEVMTYLADEKTLDLHQRLVEREAEVDRLLAERLSRIPTRHGH